MPYSLCISFSYCLSIRFVSYVSSRQSPSDITLQRPFSSSIHVDNNVPSLSIGGFTNGVRVVDMAKGYSTLANGGVYNDRTCIIKIEHEHDGELTKDLKPSAHQVYRDDSAFMLTDV